MTLVLDWIGPERRPVALVEDFMPEPAALLEYAQGGEPFRAAAGDFYPGVRKALPAQYAQTLCARYAVVLRERFGQALGSVARVVFCALSVATQQPRDLRLVQRVPHFDTSAGDQLAIVHYLCTPEHGGTSFYRHRSTGYQSITQERLRHYAHTLKHEIRTRYQPAAQYMDGDDPLFERIASYEARFNRALIYPSNVLHSGNIRQVPALPLQPQTARLTVNTFIRFPAGRP